MTSFASLQAEIALWEQDLASLEDVAAALSRW